VKQIFSYYRFLIFLFINDQRLILVSKVMAQTTHPFLRIEILKFQLNTNKQIIDLNKVKTEIEIKEKHHSSQNNNARMINILLDILTNSYFIS
jgi:hypothetical protein